MDLSESLEVAKNLVKSIDLSNEDKFLEAMTSEKNNLYVQGQLIYFLLVFSGYMHGTTWSHSIYKCTDVRVFRASGQLSESSRPCSP